MLPWVRLATRVGRCQGYRWSHMSLRASRDPELRERFRCRLGGRYRYVASRRDFGGQSGTYCWQHLFQQLTQNVPDRDRLDTWVDEHLDEVNELRARHDLKPWRSRFDVDADHDAVASS